MFLYNLKKKDKPTFLFHLFCVSFLLCLSNTLTFLKIILNKFLQILIDRSELQKEKICWICYDYISIYWFLLWQFLHLPYYSISHSTTWSTDLTDYIIPFLMWSSQPMGSILGSSPHIPDILVWIKRSNIYGGLYCTSIS